MPKYFIYHTDINKSPIEVDEGSVDDSSLDIALFGRIRLEYGERLNQNLLNMVENFSAAGDPSVVPVTPTPMPSASVTPSGLPVTPTPTPTPTRTVTPTVSVSAPVPSVTPTPTVTSTVTPTVTVSPTAGASPTPTVTPTPTIAVTPTPTPSPSPVYTVTFGSIPTAITGETTGSFASARLRFDTDLTYTIFEHAGPQDGDIGTWATTGTGSDYEMYYTYVDYSPVGKPDPGPGAGGWFPLSSNRMLEVYGGAVDPEVPEPAYMDITITIRKISNPTDTQTIVITFTAIAS